MLRTYAAHAAMFIVLYRGYDIEVSPEPSGWRAGVYPRSADLPILCRNEVHACDQDEAVIEAIDREKFDYAARAIRKTSLATHADIMAMAIDAIMATDHGRIPPSLRHGRGP